MVKYSHERLRDIADLEFAAGERDAVLVEIETLGRGGARYRSRLPWARTRGWVTMKAFGQSTVRDAAGAGDWCAAGVVDSLARGGLVELRETNGRRLKEAMQYGQALAAWNCRFEGARGGMYERSRAEFVEEVEEVRAGQALDPPADPVAREDDGKLRSVCSSCVGARSADRERVLKQRRV